jgi:ATP adenylyltransferase
MAAKKRKTVDITNSLSRKDYKETLEKIAAGGFCPFCEDYFTLNHPQPIVERNTYWYATPSNWPYKGAKRHFLLITRAHLENAEELTPRQWADLHKIFAALVTRYKLKGASLVMRSGDTAYTGASVAHLHAHLITGRRRKNPRDEILAPIGYF